MNKRTLLCIIFIIAADIAFGQNLFQSSLKSGPFSVGYKSSTHYDAGRPPLAEQNVHRQQGRPIHISTWYPAIVEPGSKEMTFSEYIDPVSQMINPGKVTASTRLKSTYEVNFFLSQLGGDTSLFKTHLPDLLKSQTTSFLNAPARKEQFPLIIFPESAHLSSLLCEYLASYGYIVVCISRFGTLAADFEWQTVRGIENLVQDCQFTIATINKEFNLNNPPIAAMGVGMNASAGLAWMMRSPSVDALISLEGGILTPYEYHLIQKSPYFDVTKATKPMLVFHSPHQAVEPALINHYKYAPRYMMYLPKMSEFYYLNFGPWEKAMKNLLGPAPGDTKQGFEIAAQYTLQFLDWKLKDKSTGRTYFEKSPNELNIPVGLVESSVKPPISIPPTPAELEKIKSSLGFDAMMREVNKHLAHDKEAFSFTFFVSISQQLITRKEFINGLQWATVFQVTYPQAVSGYTLAGRCNLELGRKEQSLPMYQKALQLLPGDQNLSEADKESLKVAIEQRISGLTEK